MSVSKSYGLTQRQIENITPRKPFYPNLDNVDDEATCKTITDFLYFIRASNEFYPVQGKQKGCLDTKGNPSPWLLCTKPIAYKDEKEKGNWQNTADMGEYACFSEFFKEPFEWQTYRIGFFCTKTENWVANKNWNKVPWHCWAIIMEPVAEEKGKGFNLIILDTNTSDSYKDIAGQTLAERQIPIERLDSMQRNFLKFFQKSRSINTVLVHGWDEGNPDGQCVKLTIEWLKIVLEEKMWKQLPITEHWDLSDGYTVNLKRKTGTWTPKDRTALPNDYSLPSRRRKPSNSATPEVPESDFEDGTPKSKQGAEDADDKEDIDEEEQDAGEMEIGEANANSSDDAMDISTYTADASFEEVDDDELLATSNTSPAYLSQTNEEEARQERKKIKNKKRSQSRKRGKAERKLGGGEASNLTTN
jgi:hypothetical protein